MASFGENLRRERELRGVSLEEIAASTKVNVRFLQALEENDLGKLPGGIFTRSFIRAYASYLGLDEEHVMAEYQLLAQPKGDVDIRRLSGNKSLQPARRPSAAILPWVLAAVMLAAGWVLFRYTHRASESQGVKAIAPAASASPVSASPQNPLATSAPSPAPTSAVPATEPTGGSQITVSPGPQSPSGKPELSAPSANPASLVDGTLSDKNSGRREPAGLGAGGGPAVTNTSPAPSLATPAGAEPAIGVGDLVLQVAATEEVWLGVDADGKAIFQHTLQPNDLRTFRAKDHFDVITGNAQGTILTLNGETLKPLGRHGELKKLHLTRDSLRNPGP